MSPDYEPLFTAILLLAVWTWFLVDIVRLVATGRCWLDSIILREERPVDYWTHFALQVAFFFLWSGLIVAWAAAGFDVADLSFLVLFAFLSLFALANLVRTIVAGSVGGAWAVGGAPSRSERPVEYWSDVANAALGLWFVCWWVVDKMTAGLDQPLSAGPVLLLIAICAAQAARLLVLGFVSAGNRHLRRIPRTGGYWLAVLFFCALGGVFIPDVLERWA